MGLSIYAYSHVRFRTADIAAADDDDFDGVLVVAPEDGTDRLDGLPPGIYDRTTLVDVWWHAEHGTFAIPPSEVAAIAERVTHLHARAIAPACPGDLAVLDAPSITEVTAFGAGSPFTYYYRWRRQLCLFALEVEPDEVRADPDRFADRPFVEQIDLPIAAGAIGPRTSAKLARDYQTHADRCPPWAAEHLEDADDRERFVARYDDWRCAFETAANGGFVIFL